LYFSVVIITKNVNMLYVLFVNAKMITEHSININGGDVHN